MEGFGQSKLLLYLSSVAIQHINTSDDVSVGAKFSGSMSRGKRIAGEAEYCCNISCDWESSAIGKDHSHTEVGKIM